MQITQPQITRITQIENNNPASLFEPSAAGVSGPAVHWTAEESLVWAEIWRAKGRADAVPIAAIRERAHLPERTIKKAVRGLRVRHSLLIGAVREKDGGYYLIQTADELEETVGYLKSQALSELVSAYILLGKSQVRLRELLGQMELEITKNSQMTQKEEQRQ